MDCGHAFPTSVEWLADRRPRALLGGRTGHPPGTTENGQVIYFTSPDEQMVYSVTVDAKTGQGRGWRVFLQSVVRSDFYTSYLPWIKDFQPLLTDNRQQSSWLNPMERSDDNAELSGSFRCRHCHDRA